MSRENQNNRDNQQCKNSKAKQNPQDSKQNSQDSKQGGMQDKR